MNRECMRNFSLPPGVTFGHFGRLNKSVTSVTDALEISRIPPTSTLPYHYIHSSLVPPCKIVSRGKKLYIMVQYRLHNSALAFVTGGASEGRGKAGAKCSHIYQSDSTSRAFQSSKSHLLVRQYIQKPRLGRASSH